MDTSVIIVGAGPVGLMLAGELRLNGVDVIVYERRLLRSGESRGVGFTARATEIFRMRGLLSRFGDVEISRQGHFGGIPMDFGVLEGSHFGARGIPQYEVEKVLEEWVLELGATLLRGYEVIDLRPGADGINAIVQGPESEFEQSAEYVVGCDGGHSTVRQLAGFEFVGVDAEREMYLADVIGAEIRPRPIGERVPGGMVMSGRLQEGVDRIIVCPTTAPPSQTRQVVEFTEVAEAWQRLTGESLAGARASWVSAFTDATRQATEYRRDRVLLAGDAAHIHLPAGGQGMSLGIQDAVNLGWKLAATVNGWAPPNLLDSYHSERHAVGQRVLRNTRAQGTLYLSGADIEPLRTVVAELVEIPEVGRHLSGMVSGLDIRYDVGSSANPLVGMRLPEVAVELADGGLRSTSTLVSPSRGALIGTGTPRTLYAAAAGWLDRIEVIPVREFPAGSALAETKSLLVRPDGYVVWADPGGGDVVEALERWFGQVRVSASA